MKLKDTRIEEAKVRNVNRSKRSPIEQLEKLDQKLGKGQGAKKERQRLKKELA